MQAGHEKALEVFEVQACECVRIPYLVAVDDGVEAMSHHDDSLAFERGPHHVLDQGVGMLVYVGGCLVHDKDLRPLEHGPSEAKELPLPNLSIAKNKKQNEATEREDARTGAV